MYNSVRIVVVLALLVTVIGSIGATPVAAQGQFGSYTSGVQVQNLESTTANIIVTAYKSDGSVDATIPDTINGNSSKTYFPLGVSSGFQGSVIVSSDKKAAAISNLVESTFKAGASYVGASAGATTVLLPLLMKGNSGFNTWFSVQNAGAGPATVNIAYSDGTNSGPHAIPVGAAKVIYQKNETHNAAVFSGSITSDQPVVAVALEEDPKTMFAYTGFAGSSTNPVMPLINANNSGYITGVQIQNNGAGPAVVTVSYTPSTAGTACTETQTIASKSSATYTLYAFGPGDPPGAVGYSTTCTQGQTFIGSAKVTANAALSAADGSSTEAAEPLVAIANQLLPGKNGGAYGAFDPGQATNKVVMPLIMDRNSGFFTGFNVMNVGSAAANVNCTFTGTGYTASNPSLSPDQALNDIQNNKIASGYIGSATCTASGASDKIVGVVNELKPGDADNFLVYEAAATN